MEKPIHSQIPLEVLFVSRDYREYRHKLTSQFRYNPNIQNVHLQLKINFALVRLKSSLPVNFFISKEFLTCLSNEFWVFRFNKNQKYGADTIDNIRLHMIALQNTFNTSVLIVFQ